eukprot:5158023-Pleurochrysis_carterae.AAC.1
MQHGQYRSGGRGDAHCAGGGARNGAQQCHGCGHGQRRLAHAMQPTSSSQYFLRANGTVSYIHNLEYQYATRGVVPNS